MAEPGLQESSDWIDLINLYEHHVCEAVLDPVAELIRGYLRICNRYLCEDLLPFNKELEGRDLADEWNGFRLMEESSQTAKFESSEGIATQLARTPGGWRLDVCDVVENAFNSLEEVAKEARGFNDWGALRAWNLFVTVSSRAAWSRDSDLPAEIETSSRDLEALIASLRQHLVTASTAHTVFLSQFGTEQLEHLLAQTLELAAFLDFDVKIDTPRLKRRQPEKGTLRVGYVVTVGLPSLQKKAKIPLELDWKMAGSRWALFDARLPIPGIAEDSSLQKAFSDNDKPRAYSGLSWAPVPPRES